MAALLARPPARKAAGRPGCTGTASRLSPASDERRPLFISAAVRHGHGRGEFEGWGLTAGVARRGREHVSNMRAAGSTGSFDPTTTPPEEPDQIRERFRVRLFGELRQAAVKGGHDGGRFDKGVKVLETVVGPFTPDLSALKEKEWVELIVDAGSLASKMVILKTHFPCVDVAQLILKKPRVFLCETNELETTCQQVVHLLREAPNAGAIIAETPDLLDPPMVASAIVTFQKWWPEKDPIQMLQEEGGYWLRFAQENEIPLEPVYYDGNSWTVPAFDTSAKLPPWKQFIAEKAKREEARAKEERGFIF